MAGTSGTEAVSGSSASAEIDAIRIAVNKKAFRVRAGGKDMWWTRGAVGVPAKKPETPPGFADLAGAPGRSSRKMQEDALPGIEARRASYRDDELARRLLIPRAMERPCGPPSPSSRRVLIVVDDAVFGEVLAEALIAVGHVVEFARPDELIDAGTDGAAFEVALVDMEARGQLAAAVVDRLRRDAPATTIIALLPCGATAAEYGGMHNQLAIETPARLKTVIAAVHAAPRLAATRARA